jgi:hypothetical protein
MRSDKPSGEPPLCDLCGGRVEDDRLPRGCKPDYVGHLYTCTHVDAVSLRELIDVSRSALKQLSDQQVHVECCNAFRPDHFLKPKTKNGGPASTYATVRVDYLRGLVFENTEAMLRTRKKEDSSAFRKTLAKDVAMVTEIAFSLLHASAISHHKDQRNRKHKATEHAQHMQHLTSLLDKHAESLGELAEGDDMLDANMMRTGIGLESDSEKNDSSSENNEGGNDHETSALEMDEEALMTPLMSEDEDDDGDVCM